ncbi:MAG TPA: RNA 2',3'-cyclic phosphodiesterase [Gaiellaceae bacterium]|nr:RNA 2',3'-cyclic phosphodiesterase [Gaiellaceae bacterium]
MGGDERLRLFCALLLPCDAVEALVRWQEAELVPAGGALRVVSRENLHVTLAFLGSTPAARLPDIVAALERARSGLAAPLLDAVRYRETRSVGMIQLSDEGARAEALAERLWDGLERLGVYTREERRWLPHVTVARFRTRPRLAPAMPALGEVVPSDAAVMISRLRPGGVQYEVFESVSLGG